MKTYDYVVEGSCHKCNHHILFRTTLSIDFKGQYNVPCKGYCPSCGAKEVKLLFNLSKTQSARNPLP